MMVDGKAIAKNILDKVARETAAISFKPKLGVMTCAPQLETQQYLDLKKRKADEVGIDVIVLELPETASTADCVACVNRLADTCHGVLVQLPLPSHIDREVVLDAVPVTKDPDGFAYGRDTRSLLPPVAAAIDAIAKEHNVNFEGKKVTVVGDGKLVGQPALRYAEKSGGDVILLTEDSDDYDEHIKSADILISGVGKPHFINESMVKDGVVIFDAGASEDGGEVVGDIHPDASKKSSIFTPVPGGIGPITVAALLHNLTTIINRL